MNGFKTTMLLAALTALFMALGYTLGGGGGAIIALLVVAAMNLVTFWNADRIVLAMHRAREVDEGSAPELVSLVRELARRAGLPMPRVYIVDDPSPNAFATGRDPQHAAVAATTGLLGLLDRDEIAGVMAHELAHVRHRDTLVMTMVATIAGAISMLAQFGLFFRGGGERHGPAWAGLLAVLVAPFAAMIVQLAISRTREYAADRAGAAISGNPRALAAALAKLQRGAEAIPGVAATRIPAAQQLYIVPGRSADSLFATHPATANRIAALEEIAQEMGMIASPEPTRRPSSGTPSVPVTKRRASALDPLA